ncbi:hypothetical protein [Ideonella sp. A 288]|uniref:hypothetical protein n=1 Tax=Ideonella sp. A 288 TaxID=1962181 RepID=UPI001186F1A2|nr:hypothetical protein [Ideonella sp. A 288]
MARADRIKGLMAHRAGRYPQPRRLALLVSRALLLPLLAGAAQAQTQPPAGLPTDVRYTPVLGTASPLLPRQPGDDADAPALLRGEPYAANAAVEQILVEVDRNAVPADGQSHVQLTVRVFGPDGKPLAGPSFVTIEHSGGRLKLPGARSDEFGSRALDADRAVPGVQVPVANGIAQFTLIAPAEAQDVRIRVTAGKSQASGIISFVPELRPMIGAGLLEGIVSFRHKATINPVRRGDAFEQEIAAWSREFNQGKANAAARAAFFLKGTISGDLLLTAAYDSDKETRARLLRDIKPDALYPVYGDASLRSFDARSGDRLYVRVDKQKSYLLYGDFVTGDGFSQAIGQGAVASLKQRSLGAYNRSATGARAHHEAGGITANAFVFNDSLRQVVEEMASQGSGPYGLRNSGAVEGSEKVEMVVRDRHQPSRIIAVKPLLRLVDYSFEPFSGRILLTQFMPSVDSDLNPVSLRVSYEVDQGGDRFWVYGGDVQARVSEAVEVGGSAVVDRNDLAPYRLSSANATWKLGPRSAIVAELARSESEINTNPVNQTATPGLATRHGKVSGNAWRVELAHEDGAVQARAFVGRSDPAFQNPAAPLQGGRGEAQLQASVALTDTLRLVGDAMRSEDRNPGGGERQSAGAGLRWALSDRLTLEAGWRSARETIGTQANGTTEQPFGATNGLSGSLATGSGGGLLGYGNQALDPSTGLPAIGAQGLGSLVSPLPAGTELSSDGVRVGLGWRVNDRLRLGGELEQSVSGDDRQRAALSADVQLTERARLYTRWERMSGWTQVQGTSATGQTANALVLGVDTTHWRDTQIFSEYRLRDALSGRDLQLASGVRSQWDLQPGLRLSTAAERIQVLSGATAQATALSAGLDFHANPLWRGSTRIEWRRSDDIANTPAVNERFDTTLWQVMATRKLDRDWTLLARNHYLRTDYTDRGEVLQDRAQLGLAWRDTDTNRVNALGKIEFKHESDASNATVGTLKTRATIVSLHADYHPSRPWWLTGRIAGKWQTDQFEQGVRSSFRAQMVAGRLVYDLSENWDIGVAAAVQTGQLGARQHAVGAEVGYLLKTNLWLSAGVNFTGFSADRDLSGDDYTQRGAYLRLRFKFDETLFKGADPEVNRSLGR